MALDSALHTVCLLLRDCEVQVLGMVAAVRLGSFAGFPWRWKSPKLAGAGHVARVPSVGSGPAARGKTAVWEFPTCLSLSLTILICYLYYFRLFWGGGGGGTVLTEYLSYLVKKELYALLASVCKCSSFINTYWTCLTQPNIVKF
jgi:hypothetical protein